jgi:hypothetical protein
METKHTHTSKLLEGLFRLPPVLTHKADRSTAIAPNVTMTQAWDGMLTVTLYDTVILQRVKSTTYVAHGGHQTATTMRWILSALEALSLPCEGTRKGKTFVVNGVEVDGLTQVAE